MGGQGPIGIVAGGPIVDLNAGQAMAVDRQDGQLLIVQIRLEHHGFGAPTAPLHALPEMPDVIVAKRDQLGKLIHKQVQVIHAVQRHGQVEDRPVLH